MAGFFFIQDRTENRIRNSYNTFKPSAKKGKRGRLSLRIHLIYKAHVMLKDTWKDKKKMRLENIHTSLTHDNFKSMKVYPSFGIIGVQSSKYMNRSLYAYCSA